MLNQIKNEYDVIVVGGGHAGTEACYATSRMGLKTLMVCLNFRMVSNMPCNPHIGGSAKGIVVREIDALGGIMGIMADKKGSLLQIKELNTSKGPGVRCLRAQEDKLGYPKNVQEFLLGVENLDIVEDEVKSLDIQDHRIHGVLLEKHGFVPCKGIILATGTHMEARILRGHVIKDEGPDGERPSHGLSKSLSDLGIHLQRLKTGTPPRLDPASIDFSILKPEYGQDGNLAFSYDTTSFMRKEDMVCCYLTYTNEKTHQIIRDNLSQSAMYGGVVKGIGPRYCPSIEDKVVRFADKPRHQLFLEPESLHMDSIYVDGLSTSMPVEVQEQIVHSIVGLEHAKFLKYAYAIEYDSLEPSQLTHTLQVREYPGLYVCGQIASTSGYEEAAALGLMAGINCGLYLLKKDPLILQRDEAYIGIMIDDIVTKGTKEPYRLLSSRSEYRLITRNDNADSRLSEYGYKVGLNSLERYQRLKGHNDKVKEAIVSLSSLQVASNQKLIDYIVSLGFPRPNGNESLKNTLRRQNVTYKGIYECVPSLPYLDEMEAFKCETEVKYEGYILQERKEAERRKSYEELPLPENLDYLHIDGLSLEAREKLQLLRPSTLGQASRITNVHPSDIDVLSFYVRHLNSK
jgi:tRNA uridine 5-carboxymethylaminomethyl modification enzyme